jgi:hypothetical protein
VNLIDPEPVRRNRVRATLTTTGPLSVVALEFALVTDVLLLGAFISFFLAGLFWMMRRAYAPVFVLRVPSERLQRRAFIGSIVSTCVLGAGLLACWAVLVR